MAEAECFNLVTAVQARLRTALPPGSIAVDATVGTGWDTCFLAEAVGEDGRIYGFDIQQQALVQARQRLGPLLERVILFHQGHEAMAENLPAEVHGRVAVVMFNLGYLPGSDRQCTTRVETTLAALATALELLAPGGLLSVVAYTGHSGGREEAEAVKGWAESRRAEGYELEITIPPSVSGTAPEWLLICKPLPGYTAPTNFD